MKKLLLLFLIFVAACSGYKSSGNPMSPEEIRVADLAQKLENDADEFQNDSFPSIS